MPESLFDQGGSKDPWHDANPHRANIPAANPRFPQITLRNAGSFLSVLSQRSSSQLLLERTRTPLRMVFIWMTSTG